MSPEVSWLAAVAFVVLTGIVGLAGDSSARSDRSIRRLVFVGGGIVLPAALLAGLLFASWVF